jgi:hypothetical protein
MTSTNFIMKYNKMKKTLLSFLLLTITIFSFAQSQEEKDKVEQLRIAFLTEELDLSVAESQQFWPIYNEYKGTSAKTEAIIKELHKEMKKTENPSASKVQDAINDMADAKAMQVVSEREYLSQSLKVLGPDKTLKLVKSEKEFRRRIMKNLKGIGGNQGGRPGGDQRERPAGGRQGN